MSEPAPTPAGPPAGSAAPGSARFADACRLADRHADDGRRDGRLHPAVVDALARAGAFRLFLPAVLGGDEADLPTAVDAIAEVAEADPAAGWAVMIGAGPNWFAGFMPDALAAEVFMTGTGAVAGSGQAGRARPRPGPAAGGPDADWEVSGSWPYCSGAPWASWFTFNAVTDEGRAATVAVPAADVALDDGSWDVRAMRATASLTVRLDAAVVPAARRFVIDPGAPRRPEPLFRLPFLVFGQVTMAAVAVGATRRVLREFRTLAVTKQPTLSATVLADDPVVADRLARLHGAATGAAAALRDATVALWRAAVAGTASADAGLAAELAALHAVQTGTAAARTVRDLAGMSTLPETATIGRVAADLETVGHNALVSTARVAEAGRRLLRPGGSAPPGA